MNGCAPQGIITDQDRAMKNVIEIVFPNTRHRWCLWHIMKKLPEKLGRYNAFEAISTTMKRLVYDMQSPVDFDVQWNDMVDTFRLEDCEWLTGLYEERGRWVPCYVKNSFWTGMSTTQRSESMNAFFDGYVHSKTSLKQFVEQYEHAVRSKVEKESQADADSFSKQVPTATNYLMERQVQGVYTLSKFKEFQTELTGKLYCDIVTFREGQGVIDYTIREAFWLNDGRLIPKFFNVSFHPNVCEAQCSCQMFVFKGILCKHVLTIFIHHEVGLLSEKYILRRWRKDVRRGHSKMKVKFNSWENTAAEMRYRKMCVAFSEVADMAAPIIEEYENVQGWIDDKFKSLQLMESSQKGKEILKPREYVEEEKGDNEDGCNNILDPQSKIRKGRPRKNILKPTSRRSKKKSQGVENATQESIVSSPNVEGIVNHNVSQPWGVYCPPQGFFGQHSWSSQAQMGVGTSPMYGFHQLPQQSYMFGMTALNAGDMAAMQQQQHSGFGNMHGNVVGLLPGLVGLPNAPQNANFQQQHNL